MSLQRYTTSFTELIDQIDATQMPTAADGQLLIGNGTGMVLAMLTPGFGINVAAGVGTVTVSNTLLPGDLVGAVQFNSGSQTFAGDAANFYWDDTNHRLGVLTNAPHATFDNQGSHRVKREPVTTATYTVAATDFYVGVKYPTGVCTITLPASNTGDGGTREIWIGDESGNASSGGINVVPVVGEYINGVTSPFAMTAANALAIFRSDGAGGWFATLCVVSTGVTSVGFSAPVAVFTVQSSPITSSGVIQLGFQQQAANLVFAGPTTSTPAIPTFRALVAADIPSLPASIINSGTLPATYGGTGVDGATAANGTLLIGNGTGFSLNTLTAGANVTITNTAGNITIAAGASAASPEPANTVYAGPTSGSAALPTFRALVAADIPSLPASQITSGQLAVAQGGTGLDGSAAANGTLLIGNGTGFTLANLTAGSNVTITNTAGGITIAAATTGGGTGSPGGATGSVQFNSAGAFAGDASNLFWDATNHRLGILTGSPNASLDNQGSLRVHRTPVTAATYTVAATDFYLGVNYNGAVSLALPSANTGDGGGRALVICDEGGYAFTGNISLLPNGTDTINGASSYVLSLARGMVMLYTTGGGAWTASLWTPSSPVTSVGLALPSDFTVTGSPVTSSGTLTAAYANQAINTVFAGPSVGSSGTPFFRSLVSADIPGLSATKIISGLLAAAQGGTGLDGSSAPNGTLLIGNGFGYTLTTLTAGSGISITNAAGSVTISSGVPGTQSANTVYAGPTSGAAAVPAFRALVAADIPNLPASQITSGQLAAARGGTGVDGSSAANGQLLIGNGSGYTLASVATSQGIQTTTGTGSLTVGKTPLHTATDGATVTFDMSVSDLHIETLGGNRTLAVANDTVGLPFTVVLEQDGTGSRTVTWWSGIRWQGGTAPTLTTTAGQIDTFSFIKLAAGSYLGYVAGQNA